MRKTPFERATEVYEDRYGLLADAAARWRLVAWIALSLLAVSVGGLVAVALQSRVTPYIVEVDRHGYEVLVGPAEEGAIADHRIIIAQLGRFFRDFRTVLRDEQAQRVLITRVMATVATSSDAAQKVTAFYRQRSPLEVGKNASIECEVTAVLPLSDKTWQLEWSEHRFQSGTVVGTKFFKAIATIEVEPTRRMTEVMENPLGIYVVDFHVTELG